MKLFNIYIKKSESQTIEDLVVIKDGFSFPALLFNIFWFLQHRMWKECFGLVLVNAVFIFIFNKGWFGSFDIFALELGLALIISLNANYWYEQHLLAQQYQFVGCVFGKNRDEAKLRFVSNCFKDDEQNNIFCPSISNFKKTKVSTHKDIHQYFTT
jgi:hypothetical protein